VPGQISVLYQHIRPAVNSGGGDLAKTTADNVRFQAATLAQASPVIAELIKQAKPQVARRRLRSRHRHRHTDLAVSALSVPGVKSLRRQVVRTT
jgi:predicted oxidoreductase